MTDVIVEETTDYEISHHISALDRAMVRVGFTEDDATAFCSRGAILDLLRVLRGYSLLTVLKPFDRYTFVPADDGIGELLTSEAGRKLNDLFERFGFTDDELRAMADEKLLTEMLFLLRKQAVLTTVVHVIDCAAKNWHSDFMGCRGARHTHEQEFVVWENPPRLGRFKVRTLSRKTRYLRLFDMNVKVRDYLLKHPELIPERWKRYWKVDFDATTTYSRGFMIGRATYSTPALAWKEKRGEWVTDPY